MKWLCIWLIRFYQRFISPLKGRPTCRFTPSCSAYGLEAFRKRGFFVGLFLTVRRILRCNPFHPGGYDPVPNRGELFRSRTTEHSDKGTQPKRMCEDYVCRRPRGASDSDPEPTSTQATTDSTRD